MASINPRVSARRMMFSVATSSLPSDRTSVSKVTWLTTPRPSVARRLRPADSVAIWRARAMSASDVETVAGTGRDVKPGGVDRRAGPGLAIGDVRAERVVHGLDPAEGVAANHGVSDAERAVLHDELGDNAASLVHFGFQAGAVGGPVGVGPIVVQFGDGEQRFQQFFQPDAGRGAGFDDFGVATPLGGQQLIGGQLLIDRAANRSRAGRSC